MRIIIVEDEPHIREGMVSLIEGEMGYHIVGEAADGREGMKQILRRKPDLVITDIRMSEMDGLEMIRMLRENDYFGHIVILSGYSEFEYAKQAISYGVDEYLLKPLTAKKLAEVLDRIRDKINQEWVISNDTSSNILSRILLNQQIDKKEERLKEYLGEGPDYFLMAGYVGLIGENYRRIIQKAMEELREENPNLVISGCYHGDSRIYYCLLSGTIDIERQTVSLYRKLIGGYEHKIQHPMWAYEVFQNLDQIHGAGRKLRGYLSMGVASPEFCGWYTKEWVGMQKWEEYHTPTEITQKLKNSIFSGNEEEIRNSGEEMVGYYKNHQFQPAYIRQGMVKIYYMVLDILQGINKDGYGKLLNANILNQLNQAMSWNEMEMTYIELEKILLSSIQKKRMDISNYTIRRAIAYIDDHYGEKITQENVADYLGITPEYLSMLFNREMKKSFSSYMKEIRIRKAKQLLSGAPIKIYEIARQVGFSDAKYFTKVFKEEVGVSPGEFRQM